VLITLQILLKYHSLFTPSFNIIFCWLPSHVDFSGNEKAYKAAKQTDSSISYPTQISNLLLVLTNLFMTSGSKLGTHKHKINSTKFIQLYLLTPLYL